MLDTLLERLGADGLVPAGGKMRTDSTHVISAVRDLNRLELAGEAVRACLESLAVAALHVVAHLLDDSWSKRYAARIDTWRMPASATRKDELALAYGRDGHTLLKAVYAAAGDPDLAFLARLHQVEVLRVVLVQNYLIVAGKRGREVIKRREAEVEGLPPADPASPPRMTSMPGGVSSATRSGMATRCTSPRLAAPVPPALARGAKITPAQTAMARPSRPLT